MGGSPKFGVRGWARLDRPPPSDFGPTRAVLRNRSKMPENRAPGMVCAIARNRPLISTHDKIKRPKKINPGMDYARCKYQAKNKSSWLAFFP